MKKTLLVFMTCILCGMQLFSQTPDTLKCDPPVEDTAADKLLPWYNNNDYLEDFLDSINYDAASRIVGVDKVKFRIPIKFWVYRSSGGTGGPTMANLKTLISDLNKFFNVDQDTRIGFYMKCDISYIDDDDKLDLNTAQCINQTLFHKEATCINVHITGNLNGAGVTFRARLFGLDGIFVDRNSYARPDFASVLSHEVGHYLQLKHTHQGKNFPCYKEPIDRNRTYGIQVCKPFWFTGRPMCESTGDYLRDTPADPDLSTNNSCSYILTGKTDAWGDSYASPPSGSSSPDPANIMSYNGDFACSIVWSRLQIAVMLHSIERGDNNMHRAAWLDTRGMYDSYEMDNFAGAANPITVGEVQERTFNEQANGSGWSQCDVDWVQFVAPCSTTFAIYTAAIPYTTNANTRLTLYDTDGSTQLAINDNIGGGSTFSRIQYAFTQGHVYYIRVDNMGSQAVSYYTLQINGAAISGLSTICGSETLSIPNLPTGAVITWSASPTGLVNFNPAGPTTATSTTVTNIGDGTATITATIDVCGTTTITSTKTVTVGFPYFSNPISGGSVCWPNGNYTFSQQLPFGFHTPDDFQWTVPSGWTIISGQGTNTLYCNTGTMGGYVEVDVTACGLTRQNSKYVEIGSGDWWPDLTGGGDEEMRAAPTETTKLSISASPNPANDFAIITINQAKSTVTKGGAIESKRGIKEIIIANKTGIIKRKLPFSGTQSSERINIRGLEPDVYIVQVNTGKEVLSCKLIVIK